MMTITVQLSRASVVVLILNFNTMTLFSRFIFAVLPLGETASLF